MKKIHFFLIFFYTNFLFSQIEFRDVASELGAGYVIGEPFLGIGISFADFDNDGWDDLTYASDDGIEIYFLKNNNGIFNLVTLNGISNTSNTKQVLWIDYDNDGDLDFFTTSLEGVNKFYTNDGDMNFTDVSEYIGLYQNDLLTFGASFADIDNDGDLDVFISHRDPDNHNYLYRNDSGIFTDITESSGISLEPQYSFCTAIFDYNKDGFQDIYIANDKPENINRLYKNLGNGTFVDVSISSGAGIDINAMTTTVGDYNNDGWFDIYVTNTPDGNVLLRNNGDETFTDVAVETGTTFDSVGWGAVFLDADLDGLLDLYVSGSLDGSVSSYLSSAFYHQQNDGTFLIPQDIGFESDTRESYSNAIGDINNDGQPDIVVGNNSENIFLWENTSSNTNNWLKVKLEGVTTNRNGIGNTIEIHVDGQSQYRVTLAGEGYLSQNSFYEFFGIGTANEIDYIKVTWTGTDIEDMVYDIQPNQTITIKEGNGILSSPDQSIERISIYPNPSNDGVFKLSTGQNEKISLRIYDLSGRIICKYDNLKNNDQIDLSAYSKGMYLAKLSSKKKSKTLKIAIN